LPLRALARLGCRGGRVRSSDGRRFVRVHQAALDLADQQAEIADELLHALGIPRHGHLQKTAGVFDDALTLGQRKARAIQGHVDVDGELAALRWRQTERRHDRRQRRPQP